MRQRLVQYRAPSGAIHGRWYPVTVNSQDVVEIEGERCVRIDAVPPAAGRGKGLQVIPDARPIVSHSSPRWHGRKHGGGGFYENYTKDGKPVIASRASLREAQRRAAWVGEKIERMRDLPDAD
jgi:hypothetical protein